MNAREIAELIGGKLIGDEKVEVRKPVPYPDAREGDTTFLFEQNWDSEKKVGLLIANFEPSKTRCDALILTDRKEEALIKVLNLFVKKPDFDYSNPIHPTAQISNGAQIAPSVFIGKNVKIGSGTRIYPFVFIGDEVEIGKNVTIYPMVTIYDDVKIGNNVTIFSGTVIGADGFGFYRTSRGYIKIPQIGGVIVEDDCEIGANVTIDRATMGYTRIGKGTKLDDQVHVAHNVVIGEHTVIAGQTGIAGSTRIGSWVMMGGQVGIADHLEIGDNVIILAKAGVSKSLLKPGIYGGYFARERSAMLKIRALEERLPELFQRLKKLEEKVEGKDGKGEN